MALEQWVRLVPRRFGRYLMALFGGGEEGFPMEGDPVGEFLSRREEEAGQGEDEESPVPAMANAEPQAVDGETENTEVLEPAAEESEQILDGPEQVAENLVEMSLDGEEERVAQLEDEAGEIVEVTDAGLQALVAESESVEMAATTDAEPQTLEVEGQSAEAAAPSQGEEAPKDGEVDSLLDVFRTEQLSENPISALSRELSDTSVYSLLEEMKQIAEKVRKGL